MNALRIGDTAPNFTQNSTQGPINFHRWLGAAWGVLFSHPRDFTPVCTTELGYVSKLMPQFERRKVKVLATSIDSVESHRAWIADIEATHGAKVGFPILGDSDRKVATLYDMLHPGSPNTATVRSVFVVDPDKRVRAVITYPPNTGTNFDEILRIIDSLQLTDVYSVATPANWHDGDEVIIMPSVTDPEKLKRMFPKGYRVVTPYLRYTEQPNK